MSVSDSGGTYNGSAFNATAAVTGVSGPPAAQLEGVVPTPVYYAGSTATGTPHSDAPIVAGTYTVVATFPGSADYMASSSAPASFTISKATPTLSLSAPGGEFDGGPFAASVTINGPGSGDSSATSLEGVASILTYYAGHGTSGASLGSTPPDVPGTYTVVANFPGTADYTATQSAPVSFSIGKATPTVTLTSSVGSAVFGQAVTLVATVNAPGGPTSGTVTISEGGITLGTVPVKGSGAATLTTSALAIGAQSITATYSGDTGLQSASSAAASVRVARDGTEVVLVPQPVFKKKKVVSVGLEAVIKPLAPGGGVPTGVVTFEVQSRKRKKVTEKVLGTVPVNSSGAATLTVKLSGMLKKTITILYGGDTDFTSSNATPPVLTNRAQEPGAAVGRPAASRPRKPPTAGTRKDLKPGPRPVEFPRVPSVSDVRHDALIV